MSMIGGMTTTPGIYNTQSAKSAPSAAARFSGSATHRSVEDKNSANFIFGGLECAIPLMMMGATALALRPLRNKTGFKLMYRVSSYPFRKMVGLFGKIKGEGGLFGRAFNFIKDKVKALYDTAYKQITGRFAAGTGNVGAEAVETVAQNTNIVA